MKRLTTLNSDSSRRVRAAGFPLLGALLPLGALSAACADAAPRELGFTQSAQELSQIPSEPFFSAANEFVGSWVGTAEEPLALSASDETSIYHFPSGSSRIAVDIQQGEGGLLTGHVRFGSGEPPPPADNPDVGYPAGVAYDPLLGYKSDTFGDANQFTSYVPTTRNLPPFEGFSYNFTLAGALLGDETGVQIGDGVASLAFSVNEPLAGWCAMQTPYPHAYTPDFSCMPDYGGQFEAGSDGTGQICHLWGPSDTSACLPDLSDFATCIDLGEPVAQLDCDKATMCSSGFCFCDATSCQAADTAGRLTLRRVGNELVGLFENTSFKNARGLNTPIGAVHLQLE